MKVAVIGAGLTGLTIAFRLSQKGHQTIIFEKNRFIGGLAAGTKRKAWQWYLDNYFHHLFTSDESARNLIDELGLENRLVFHSAKTSIYLNGRTSRFDSPTSVLKFPGLSFPQKARTGLVTLRLRLINNWSKFEKITAEEWLNCHYGPKVYQDIWAPLLKAKFGPKANQVSMAWFWGRIKKRSQRLGYLEGGFQILIDELVKKIKKNGGQFQLNHKIKNLRDINQPKFDKIIFTTPASTFLRITAGQLPQTYQKQLANLKMVGAVNLVLVLQKRFLEDNTYWLNVNQRGFPFVAVVEHTNFVNPKHYNGNHILYVGGYYPQNHRYFKAKKGTILKEFLPYLQRINSRFKASEFKSFRVSKNLFSQPVIPVNYSQLIPEIKTPLPNTFLANMQMIYPWDRGLNNAIDLGEKVVHEVNQN